MYMDHLLYGVAYYDEYMPEERLELDMEMLENAGMNLIRVAESTWATEEPKNGVFDFSHVHRAIKAAARRGISVIVGTPTYAVPPWLAAEYPQVLAMGDNGPRKYGPRQIMDITHPAYLFHAERVIRKLMEAVQGYDNVIGFQLDNETKHYETAGPGVQKRFIRYLREKFGSLEELNKEFGFNYWSNRIDAWENVPDPTGSINGSYRAEFEKFRRGLVTEFLQWQSDIVSSYCKPGQFLTHNFDFEWRGYSFGVQPQVDHKLASQAITIAGCDIYHPSQEKLTGKEIAFCGDLTRNLKHGNYLVLETEAQGFPQWTPFPGQLRLQAFSHLASGANCVEYWHWHSIHNSFETYWKGVLSHDLKPNRVYQEACSIGKDFQRLSDHLVNLRKENKVAFLVSVEALEGLRQFPISRGMGYNDVVRALYDVLYEMNVECDVIFPQDVDKLSRYTMVVVPCLYSAPNSLIQALDHYTAEGGRLIATFKTGFSNEYLTVAHDQQPHMLTKCFGVTYDQFTYPSLVALTGDDFDLSEEERQVYTWMELLSPTTAQVVSSYDHPFWGQYAAVTENTYGKGVGVYLGCLPDKGYLKAFFQRQLTLAGLWGAAQQLTFPVIVRSGVNHLGKLIHYYFNYSMEKQTFQNVYGSGKELLSGQTIEKGQTYSLKSWGLCILEEDS